MYVEYIYTIRKKVFLNMYVTYIYTIRKNLFLNMLMKQFGEKVLLNMLTKLEKFRFERFEQ